MYLSSYLTTVILLSGAVTGLASDLVAANRRSPRPNAAASEHLSVDGNRPSSNRRHDVSVRFSDRIAAFIPRAALVVEVPTPATRPETPTEPEAPTEPNAPTIPKAPTEPTEPEEQGSDNDSDDDDDGDGDVPDTPEQPKSKDTGDGNDNDSDTDSGESPDFDDDNNTSTSSCAHHTGLASAGCVSTAKLPLGTTTAAVSVAAATSSTDTPSFAAASMITSTTQAITPASTAVAPTTSSSSSSSFTAAAAGVDAQNPFACVKWKSGGGSGVTITVGVYTMAYVACLAFFGRV